MRSLLFRSLPLLLPLTSGGVVAACAPPEASTEAQPPLRVESRTLAPELGYDVRRRFTGVVRSRRESGLGFERPGLVTSIQVDEGDDVRAGQVLASLDVAQLEVRRRQLVASLREAEAQVELSDLTSSRLTELAEARYASRQSSDEARLGLAARQAAADQLRAAIDAVDVELRKSRLVAPFGGTVARRLADEGAVVQAGQPVLRFLERERAEAVVGVPVGDASNLKVGSTHDVWLGDRRVAATLTASVDDVDPRTRTRSLVFALPDDAEATDGQVIQLEVSRRVESRGYWVPLDAMTEGLRGLWTVYTVTEEGRIAPEAVQVLHLEDDRAFVRGTLEPGDEIVVSGLHRVVPGQAVFLARADDGADLEAEESAP